MCLNTLGLSEEIANEIKSALYAKRLSSIDKSHRDQSPLAPTSIQYNPLYQKDGKILTGEKKKSYPTKIRFGASLPYF